MSHMKWLSATLVVVLMASTATAADTVAGGTVKSINADNKTFVLTDSANKDFTFKLGQNVVINRAGKESSADLKAGDSIYVAYDKGILTWTANYILVQEGASAHWELICGTVKGSDLAKKEFTLTNEDKRDSTYSTDNAAVRINMENSRFDNVRIGDHAVLVVDKGGARPVVRSVMIERAK